MPVEWGGLLACWVPEQEKHREHHKELVDVVPRLDGEFVESHTVIGRRGHEKLVVESADGTQHIGQDDKENVLVVLEINTFLPARTRKHVEANHSNDDTHPLPEIKSLGEECECADKYHHRTGGVDRTDDGDREMLETKVGKEPAAQYDDRLQKDVFVFGPTV